MLCSARELGLGDDHTGILVLPADTPLGAPYGEALGLERRVVFDLDVTRNRPDCWSYLGVARDLAAQLGVAVHAAAPPELGATATEPVDDRRDASPATAAAGSRRPCCPACASARRRRGWRRRLTAAGMRPINNVVDVSNYVMLELGQPNHAYDLATLGGGGFRVRLAPEGETLTTLDDVDAHARPPTTC